MLLYFFSLGGCSYWCHYKLMGTPYAAFSRKSGCLTLPFLLCKWLLAARHALEAWAWAWAFVRRCWDCGRGGTETQAAGEILMPL